MNVGKLNRQQYEIRNHINYHKSEHREIEYANISKSEITLTIIRVNIGKLNRQQYEIRNHINYHRVKLLEIEHSMAYSKQGVFLSLITMSSNYIFIIHHWQGLQISYKQLSSLLRYKLNIGQVG